MHFSNHGKMPYTAEKVFQKAHHTVLAFGVYVDACKKWGKNPTFEKRGLDSIFFVDEYHDLKLD